jgi:hypothetical protein
MKEEIVSMFAGTQITLNLQSLKTAQGEYGLSQGFIVAITCTAIRKRLPMTLRFYVPCASFIPP